MTDVRASNDDRFANVFPTSDELKMLREAYAETYPVRPLLNEIDRLRPMAESWESYVAAQERKGASGETCDDCQNRACIKAHDDAVEMVRTAVLLHKRNCDCEACYWIGRSPLAQQQDRERRSLKAFSATEVKP